MGAIFNTAVAMTALLGLTACNEDTTIEWAMAKYRHVRLVPPTANFGPGSLVAKKNYNPWIPFVKSVELDDLCIRRYSIDKYGVTPQVSETETREFSGIVGGKFSLDSPALKKIVDINIDAKIVDHATIVVKDIKVFTFSAEDRSNIIDLLEKKCRAIVNRQIDRKNAWQIRSVVQATIDVEFVYEAGASAAARAEVIKKLADVSVKVDDFDGRTHVYGKGLVYGVDLDRLEGKI